MGYGVIGNTTDSDSVIPGSSPGTPANHKKNMLKIIRNFLYLSQVIKGRFYVFGR